MRQHKAALAVRLHEMQWELDEAAYEVGGGRFTADQRFALADKLRALAEELGEDQVMTIDGSTL
ncbi:hypothetical protein AB8O55_14275 [Saccharopolyspora cebuensis]|uniref:Uncharacterized protein n=1 Tax=Saccharopolyspora cebuensis TaxID=418759 RepID=A0ABV4CJB9_9PSEU